MNLYALRSNHWTRTHRALLATPDGASTTVAGGYDTTLMGMAITPDGPINVLQLTDDATKLIRIDPAAGFANQQVTLGPAMAVRDMDAGPDGSLHFTGGPLDDLGVWLIAPDGALAKLPALIPGLPFSPTSNPSAIHCDQASGTLWVAQNSPSVEARVYTIDLASGDAALWCQIAGCPQPSVRGISYDPVSRLPIVGLDAYATVGYLDQSGVAQASIRIARPADVDLR
ncbi:hypothetical protein [Engelhardtia mirabilis]|uniref:SMP-30/Gluconolaconase/LRE-like region n=1 Tax=Engelhardtia mirabilis TaxID=2528011 RepID=A0A518BS10_9BACT|nr:hypothetical protein Pla133_48840 [Planctomycetes bacterium Pla133]QDV04088.1 hypothetical protein Pla86_48820 [Planctomycetes bacterium Pla86]